MRIGILALLQESNTFIRGRTEFRHFQEDLLVTGEEMRQRLAGSFHEIGGFFTGCAEEKLMAVPVFAARALPFGTVKADAFAQLVQRMLSELAKAGSLDGLLVTPHGATVSEAHPDADGYWLEQVRMAVGPQMPIIGTLDPHGNLSARMVQATNALLPYRSNPHLDQKERGIEAARLMARTLRGEVRPTQAAAFPPLAINIERQLTSDPPCKPLFDHAEEIRRRPNVLGCGIMLGFPYADVAEMGSATIAITDNNPRLAQAWANELALDLWNHRQDFLGQFITVDEAVTQAQSLPGPICLLDMGDNVGGGSPADGTLIAHALHERRVGPSFVCLYDPQAVQAAEAAGIGAEVELTVGGKSDDLHGPPLTSRFHVLDVRDGRFEEKQVRHGGFGQFDQGRTAVVRADSGLTVMLTTRRMAPFSLAQLTGLGVDPTKFHVLVAKGVIAPVAAYAPVSKHLIRVNTPGATCADMRQLTYHHRRKPMFPLEMETQWEPKASVEA